MGKEELAGKLRQVFQLCVPNMAEIFIIILCKKWKTSLRILWEISKTFFRVSHDFANFLLKFSDMYTSCSVPRAAIGGLFLLANDNVEHRTGS